MATETMSDLEVAVSRILKGVRDPEAGAKALKEMERMREETRKRVGTVNAAVCLIRDARDQ